jgi:hypothetical protein
VDAEEVRGKICRLNGKVGKNLCNWSYGMGNMERAGIGPFGF